jgi:hypothetical protein
MNSGITPDYLEAVLAHVAARPSLAYEALVQDLRTTFPGHHISMCGGDDVSPRLSPAAENGSCEIYYVATGEHCLSLTNDVAAATGIVVALRDDED